MQRLNGVKCMDLSCEYGTKKHVHVHTPNGSYVRWIVEKPKGTVEKINQISDDDLIA